VSPTGLAGTVTLVTTRLVRMVLASFVATVFGGLLLTPATALASAKVYECQKPVRTGVEVSALHDVTPAVACVPALALFAWESKSAAHIEALYGCHRPKPGEAGTPYLRMHSFHGWRLSLTGRYGAFTMSRGKSSFDLSGTDFPLNCT
jgi:hypothetical protein